MTKARDLANVATNATDAANAIPDTLVDAKGDLIVASAADTVLRLGVGTNNHVLTADSSTTSGVKWAALPSSGGMTELASGTFSTSVSTVTLSNISGSYKDLRLVIRDGNTGSTYYSLGLWAPTAGNVATIGGKETAFLITYDNAAASNNRNKTVFNLFDYANTTELQIASWNTIYQSSTNNEVFQTRSGAFLDNGAVTSITIMSNGGANFSGGNYILYGVN
jgi:hypothetical protein